MQNRTVHSRILTLNGALKKSGTLLVEPISVVQRPHPAFVLDLSGENLPHHLYHEPPIELGGVLKSEWSNATFFGGDAFHAFVDERADFTCQDVVGTASRVDRYMQHQPGSPYCIPGVKRDGDMVTLDFTEIPDEAVCKCVGDVYFGTPIEPLNWGDVAAALHSFGRRLYGIRAQRPIRLLVQAGMVAQVAAFHGGR